jgi:hypothetical protein
MCQSSDRPNGYERPGNRYVVPAAIVPMHLRLTYLQIWNVLHFDFSGSTEICEEQGRTHYVLDYHGTQPEISILKVA